MGTMRLSSPNGNDDRCLAAEVFLDVIGRQVLHPDGVHSKSSSHCLSAEESVRRTARLFHQCARNPSRLAARSSQEGGPQRRPLSRLTTDVPFRASCSEVQWTDVF